MTPTLMPMLLLAVSAALAAPSISDDEYTIILPQKRAALVLDRLLVALQKALNDGPESRYARPDRDGPRASPLRISAIDENAMMLGERSHAVLPQSALEAVIGPPPLSLDTLGEVMNALQRRGIEGRGRVVKCYFNAVTCF